MSDEQAAMDQVGRYWDAVAGGDSATGHALDPALARTIHRIHGLAATPSAEARERVWQSVLANAEASRRQDEGSMLRVLVPDSRALNRPDVGIPGGGTRGRQRALLAQIATAALLVLTLVGSFIVFGTGRVSRHESPPVFIPAIEATPAAPGAQAPIAQFLWASKGGSGVPFDDPTTLAVAPDGNLWVPDGDNGRFQILTPDGEFVETWGTPGSGEGEFNFAFEDSTYGAVAWDVDGNIYVADTGNFRIQKFAPDRRYLDAWGVRGNDAGQFQAVTNLAVDGDGRIFAVDSERYDIQIFAADGTFLGAWSGQGTGDGELLKPGGAAFDAEGNLYVSDSLNYRVQSFAPDGRPRGSWRSNGTGDGALVNPTDVAIDAQGRVFVAGVGNHRVQIFAADGTFLGAWGELGSDAGQFVDPQHLALDDAGNIYVSDEGNDRVQKFRLLPPLGPG